MVEGADPAHWNSKMSCWNQTSGAPANNNHQGTNGCACACANPLDWSWMSNSSVDKSRHFGGMNVLGSLFLRNFERTLLLVVHHVYFPNSVFSKQILFVVYLDIGLQLAYRESLTLAIVYVSSGLTIMFQIGSLASLELASLNSRVYA